MIAKGGHYEAVAREGIAFILPLLIVALLSWITGHSVAALVLIVLAVAVALFFRNPERVTPQEDGIIVSPADGRVVTIIDDVRSENLAGLPLRRVSIFMSIFNVHVNRCPITGTIEKIAHVPGRFLDARDPQASLVNEHNRVVMKGDDGPIEVVQIAGKIARRIACWVRVGDSVRQGERFGLIRFGSRLDVYVPENYSFVVRIGNTVRAGESVIARKN
jgi:phosphatidylserine decarboxylase